MNKRMLPGLRAHVDQLLRDGWWISARDPLTLKRGSDRLQCLDGMLVGSAQSNLDIELGSCGAGPVTMPSLMNAICPAGTAVPRAAITTLFRRRTRQVPAPSSTSITSPPCARRPVRAR